MSKRKRNKEKRWKLLDGHKKVGKRFVPPMMQLPMNTSVSYVNDMLPELVWIGLLNEKIGYVRAARVLEKIFLMVEDVKDTEQHGNFALISTFNLLNDDQKISLREKLNEEGLLELLQDTLAPLTLLYENCPLSFLGPPSSVYTEEELVAILKKCVGRVINKYDTPGVLLNGAMLLSRLVTKTIKFLSDINLPDFNAVINSPGSDEAKHAAGFMRAYALGEFGTLKVDTSWARHFWNQSFELSPCEFSREISSE
ncbi:hypothetical protein DRQ00_05660 [candidate division KSB1 bacterium]|nr:MAG: hypothetical protein DRQ00_05660 [candidate division KSB1 bacterium]